MDDVSRPEHDDGLDDDGRGEDEGPPIAFTPRELAMIAEAEESIEKYGTIPGEEVHAWLNSLFTPNPLPRPEPRKPG